MLPQPNLGNWNSRKKSEPFKNLKVVKDKERLRNHQTGGEKYNARSCMGSGTKKKKGIPGKTREIKIKSRV